MISDKLPFYFILLEGNKVKGNHTIFSDGDYVSTIGLCGFLICLEGQIKIMHDGTQYVMRKGDMYLNTSSVMLRLLARSDDFKGSVIVSKVDFVMTLVHKVTSPQNIMFLRSNPCVSLTMEQFDKFESDMMEVCDKIKKWDNTRISPQQELLHIELIKSMAQCICFELLILFFKNHPVRPLTLSRGDEIFHEFMRNLTANYRTERHLDAYAKMLEITPRYFSRLIKSKTGMSPTQWIDQAVISEAKQELENTSKSIKMIGLELGFPNQSFFGKYFREHVGVSPFRYRSQFPKK